MSDFHQTGCVATLHRLNPDGLERLEEALREYSQVRPIGLVLPALYSEFETTAMHRIVRQLSEVDYIRQTVVALGRATREQYEHAREFFRDFRSPVTVIWVDSEAVQNLFWMLEERGIPAGSDGKGRSCWLAYGYLLAQGDCQVVALHDCDIKNYDRQFLARLCYPVENPEPGFEFCKAYYARVTNRLHGRVTRLFLTPLMRAIEAWRPATPFVSSWIASAIRWLESSPWKSGWRG